MIRVDLVGGSKWFRWDSLIFFATSVSALVLVYLHVIYSYYTVIPAGHMCKSRYHKPQYFILSVNIPICTNTDIKFTPNYQWTKWCPNMLWLSVPQHMWDGMQAVKTCCLTSTSLIARLCTTHPPLNQEMKLGTETWTLRTIHYCLRSFRNQKLSGWFHMKFEIYCSISGSVLWGGESTWHNTESLLRKVTALYCPHCVEPRNTEAAGQHAKDRTKTIQRATPVYEFGLWCHIDVQNAMGMM